MNPLIRWIPPFMVRFFARPYVAGDSMAKGVGAAARLWQERGIRSSLDLLAEDIESDDQARRNLEVYLDMVDVVAADTRFAGDVDAAAGLPTLSLKASSYTTAPLERGGDAAGSREAIFAIAERGREKGVPLTVDMESRHWTDWTLDLVRDLHEAGQTHVGAVLQTRLERTRADLDRLPPKCRVRLVIGIYQEPADVATTDKAVMKERMLEYAAILLERGHYVEFATHDRAYVQRFLDQVIPAAGVGPDRFEVQLLFGVPRGKLLDQLRSRQVIARLYVPFALSWGMAIEYLRRRLDEYPAMMFLVLKNIFGRR